MIYSKSVKTDALRQGEILSSVIQIKPGTPGESPSGDPPRISTTVITHGFSVIVSQDCDLASDHLNRGFLQDPALPEDKKANVRLKLLQNVVLCEANFFSDISSAPGIDSKDRLKKNQDIKYHYLQSLDAANDLENNGIGALVVSFNRVFTVSCEDLLERIRTDQTKRRASMQSPYFEHLSDRFCYYIGRIGLPQDHQ